MEYEQLWNVDDTAAASRQRPSTSSSSSSSRSGDDDIDGGCEEVQAGPVSLPYFVGGQSSGTEPRPDNVLGLGRKKGLPPSPPPRPGKTHTRSASLDLNKLSTKQSLPSLPPRASPYHKPSDTGDTSQHGSLLSSDSYNFPQVRTVTPGIPGSYQRVFTDTKKVLRFYQGQFRSYRR